jgi:hypothetical protein
MQRVILFFTALAIALTSYAQTVENIRVVQDGENLKINYRIGASTGAQLYNVYLSCSMDGGRRFEPKAVIGDVGENIVGGRSYYEVIWDVFEDVDEVVNPEFFVRVELVSDMAAVAATPAATQTQTRTTETPKEVPKETPKEVEKKPAETQESPFEPSFEEDARDSKPVNEFERNGFFAYNGSWYIPIGISFGSLNNWGYYVSFRMGIHLDSYEAIDDWGFNETVYNNDIDLMTAAGVTKHIVSAGFYRLHAYGGLGGHLSVINSNPSTGHVMIDTGLINVLGMFNLTLGFSYSFGDGYPVSAWYPTNLVFGAGFVF